MCHRVAFVAVARRRGGDDETATVAQEFVVALPRDYQSFDDYDDRKSGCGDGCDESVIQSALGTAPGNGSVRGDRGPASCLGLWVAVVVVDVYFLWELRRSRCSLLINRKVKIS